MSLTIALTYDLKADYEITESMPVDELAEFDSEEVIAGLEQSMIELGHKPIRVGNLFQLVRALAAGEHKAWDLVWNAAEGYHGTAREAQVPGLLEAWQIPCIFSNAATLASIHDKALTKMILAHRGVATAPFLTIRWQDEVPTLGVEEWRRRFPRLEDDLQIFTTRIPAVFVKPTMEGSSKGIYTSNKAHSAEDLNAAIRTLRQRFPTQNLIIEPFLQGREFSVSILGSGGEARVLGAVEFQFKPGSTTDFLALELKDDDNAWLDIIKDTKDSSIDPLVETVKTLALEAWRAIGCYDAGRVDVRCQGIGDEARPFVLEINALAGMCQGVSALPLTATNAGMDYNTLVGEIIHSAMQRIPTRR
ncbi:uncharacterized protein RCC_12270 [Ramularia collo-cygni]|uniref:ATP-grasp domain-containing protein n=1 Tax=Ramularia collo-cygni TaxID=112498 RepID=A0A2D3V0D3_9PEZI|nr:uncharacterized protein RCC_12270 [Ramularia collo-cygni]CZT14959.1 uncharacterized protein RCC_12270 [Ramularia collo-cygni]